MKTEANRSMDINQHNEGQKNPGEDEKALTLQESFYTLSAPSASVGGIRLLEAKFETREGPNSGVSHCARAGGPIISLN